MFRVHRKIWRRVISICVYVLCCEDINSLSHFFFFFLFLQIFRKNFKDMSVIIIKPCPISPFPSTGFFGKATISYLGPAAPTPWTTLMTVPSLSSLGLGHWELIPSSLWRSTWGGIRDENKHVERSGYGWGSFQLVQVLTQKNTYLADGFERTGINLVQKRRFRYAIIFAPKDNYANWCIVGE